MPIADSPCSSLRGRKIAHRSPGIRTPERKRYHAVRLSDDGEDLHNFVAVVVDDLYCNLAEVVRGEHLHARRQRGQFFHGFRSAGAVVELDSRVPAAAVFESFERNNWRYLQPH